MTHEEEQEQALKTEQKDIEDAKRVREFLADSAISEALLRIEKKYLADFRVADTDDKRRNVWASTQALTAFVDELQGTLARGQMAQHVRTTRTASEGRNSRKS